MGSECFDGNSVFLIKTACELDGKMTMHQSETGKEKIESLISICKLVRQGWSMRQQTWLVSGQGKQCHTWVSLAVLGDLTICWVGSFLSMWL